MEQFPDINKLCNVASCWIYEYTGLLLGVHYILHISRIRVNNSSGGLIHEYENVKRKLFSTVMLIFILTGSVIKRDIIILVVF